MAAAGQMTARNAATVNRCMAMIEIQKGIIERKNSELFRIDGDDFVDDGAKE